MECVIEKRWSVSFIYRNPPPFSVVWCNGEGAFTQIEQRQLKIHRDSSKITKTHSAIFLDNTWCLRNVASCDTILLEHRIDSATYQIFLLDAFMVLLQVRIQSHLTHVWSSHYLWGILHLLLVILVHFICPEHRRGIARDRCRFHYIEDAHRPPKRNPDTTFYFSFVVFIEPDSMSFSGTQINWNLSHSKTI